MFGRRVFGSVPIPRAMYASLHINTAAQASRILPALVPLSSGIVVAASLLPRTAQGPCDSCLAVVEQDPLLFKNLIASASPLQMGYLRLLELWGIARVGIVNKLLGRSGKPT